MSDVGKTVRLKSGGPMMTVTDASGGILRCMWFDGSGKQLISVPSTAVWLWTKADEERERKRQEPKKRVVKPRVSRPSTDAREILSACLGGGR